jgi:hypothetical protein
MGIAKTEARVRALIVEAAERGIEQGRKEGIAQMKGHAVLFKGPNMIARDVLDGRTEGTPFGIALHEDEPPQPTGENMTETKPSSYADEAFLWERCTHEGIGMPGCTTCDPIPEHWRRRLQLLEADRLQLLLATQNASLDVGVVDPLFGVHMLNELGKTKAKQIARGFTAMLELLKFAAGGEGRELAIVKTKLEEACFFAKKAMASRPENQQ